MARKILETHYDPEEMDSRLDKFTQELIKGGLNPMISPWLLFKGEHHFNAMPFNSTSRKFPNGQYKLGTIRYKPDHVCLPLSDKLLTFETDEFQRGKIARNYARLKYLAVCPLEELTDEEILKDGFNDRKDMLHQMTEMGGRYYQDLKPTSLVSYFAFKGVGPIDYWPDMDTYEIIGALQKKGYWDELKKKDTTGWTKEIIKALNGTFSDVQLEL